MHSNFSQAYGKEKKKKREKKEKGRQNRMRMCVHTMEKSYLNSDHEMVSE